MNPFATDAAQARRYHDHRPRFHDDAVRRLIAAVPLAAVDTALDAGCGTGHGSHALLAVARRVIACDPAPAMLAQILPHPRLHACAAPAEALPGDEPVDLITAFLAFHWFDQPRFLAEVARRLRPGGVLAIANHGMTGVVDGHPGFTAWHHTWVERHPAPARASPDPTAALATCAWAAPVATCAWREDWCSDRDSIAAYLATQSNATAACAAGADANALAAGIRDELRGVLPPGPLRLVMAGRWWWCRRR